MKWPGSLPIPEPPAATLPWRGDRPAVFLDMEGTLVADRPDRVDPAQLRFVPHAFEALRVLRDAGYAPVIVAHQPGIAQHRLARQAFARLEAALLGRLADAGLRIERIHLCPHGGEPKPGGACLCRKPAPGLLRQAAISHRLHLPSSWMIGATLDDVEAGHRAGCRSVLLDVGSETAWRQSPLRVPEHRSGDLLSAAEFIVASTAPVEARPQARDDWPARPPLSAMAHGAHPTAFGNSS
jgi:D-glycero-D-manno-heptose 1,7-bisphosphate phosphatase